MSPSDAAEDRFQTALRAHQQGQLDQAERLYRILLDAAPGHAPARNNLGLLLAASGRLQQAVGCFRGALASDPTSADAALNLAQALEQSGNTAEALAAWRAAAALRPEQMEPMLAAAVLAARAGSPGEAVSMLEQAAQRRARRPGTPAVLARQVQSLAGACVDAGDMDPAHRLGSLLARLDPRGDTAPRILARCLRTASARHFDPALKQDLLICYACDALDHRDLARLAAQLLLLEHPVLATSAPPGALRDAVDAAGTHRDPLLLALLWRSVNVDPALETALVRLRGELVAAVAAGETLDGPWRDFLTALAAQCFGNEYVFACGEDATSLLDDLWPQATADPASWQAFAAATTLAPPSALGGARALAAREAGAPGWVHALLRRTVIEPLRERELRAALHAGLPGDAVSRAVQRQYEESPYPRWQNLERQAQGSVAALLADTLPHYRPAGVLAGDVDILVAGCGTGEHALRVAARHPRCRVHAIDLSSASLAYAQRKAAELGLANVHLRQRDILALDPRDGTYHVIESVGVLHHMADPAAGLTALGRVLAPGGVIKLGLYSRAARARVNRARERIAELGLEATPRDMRSLRQRILSGLEPELARLTRSQDFYTLSTVRDLLFHVQEQQFDVPALRALLERCDLTVIGFQVPPGTRRRYLERYPDDVALANLQHWHDFEREFPDTFAGMYQFWCARR